ncbi:MAG: hypothetical protein RLZZ214_852, partial [Verrucomicrobiota bacterium]
RMTQVPRLGEPFVGADFAATGDCRYTKKPDGVDPSGF